MTIQDVLNEYAAELASDKKARVPQIRDDIAQAKRALEEKEVDLRRALDGVNRAREFVARNDRSCPRCWINHRAAAAVLPIGRPPDGIASADYWKCSVCKTEFVSPST